ncbi:Hint domain-containing protein [Pseudogemmobacter bohemicus]|uniref:Hint domain-containing protein n=1 Tax=Pseudogemmobacter bohemicus TaxID=2250708 RepID=UPI000DD4D1D1|nr:Hint domain-containing protein [Pseudogemmobacter bohemicus]
MPVTNVIVNGGFDQGSSGWSGTDLETSYTENAYLGNGSNNHLAELDGRTGYTTVMEQTFHIDRVGEFPLSFRGALRSGVAGSTSEGYRVEILDNSGNALFSRDIHPVTTTWQTYTFPIDFPAIGDYTIRFTELGPDNSLGGLVDDISLLVCFVAGTLITTPDGQRPVEDLRPGDLVCNIEGEALPVIWAGSRRVPMEDQIVDENLRPVIFEPGSLGKGLPERRLMVSPQHRMLVSGWKAELWFAESEVLVPAISLVNGDTIRQSTADDDVTYVHFLFEGHEIVLAEGSPSESFHPGDHSLKGLERTARDEILVLFPELNAAPVIAARQVVRRQLAGVLAN